LRLSIYATKYEVRSGFPFDRILRESTVILISAEVLHLSVLLLINYRQSVMVVVDQIKRFLLMLMLKYLLDTDTDDRKHNLVFLKL
jgi:hypothetical protein